MSDGGPAFPKPIGNNGANNWQDREVSSEEVGMSLRDYFAGQALKGMLAQPADAQNIACYDDTNNAARWAYNFAEAMLKARDTA